MTSPANQLGEDTVQTAAAAKKGPFSVNFFGKRFVELIGNALIGEAKSRLNKLVYSATAQKIASDEVQALTIGKLDLFIGRDENGYLRGGDLPWQYMQGVTDGVITDREKREQLARTLAQLPSNISYTFKAAPQLRDREIVRAAFARAGFVNERRTTQIYTNEPGSDAVDRMKSDARTKIRKGRKELEFTDMSVDDFFKHYRENLGERHSHFFLNIDNALLKQALSGENPQAEIIAVRRKPDENGTKQPIEAAAIISTGADGYCKLLRLTFRRFAEKDEGLPPPHQQALKVLVVEAMNRAAARGLPLDVDGFTPGGNTVYSRFGVFETVTHDQFARVTPGAAMASFTKRLRELTATQSGRFFA